MSGNLELVRSIYPAWERGDYSSTEWAHPEIEWVFCDGPTPGSWTGLAGLAEAWREFLNAWEDFRIEVEECSELDGERVLMLHQWSARGKKSGLELGQIRSKAASIIHVRDGTVTRFINYWNRERALAELGLTSDIESRS